MAGTGMWGGEGGVKEGEEEGKGGPLGGGEGGEGGTLAKREGRASLDSFKILRVIGKGRGGGGRKEGGKEGGRKGGREGGREGGRTPTHDRIVGALSAAPDTT
jgi:ATP-dependent RNA helicase RhlE